MPGVNLDFLPASEASEALGSPDSPCAESGLEEVIGNLLAQEKTEEEEQPLEVNKFELTLRCAVSEIHCDLQAFGKQVDARLEEAGAQVTCLAQTLARLQEENKSLRMHQEKVVQQVEALYQALGLPHPQLHEFPSQEDSHETKPLPSEIPHCTDQEPEPEALNDPSSFTALDCSAISQQDTPPNSPTPSQSIGSQKTSPSLQEPESTETSTPQTSESSSVPHPPTFASRRSLSAPSLMANISFSDSMVPLSIIFNAFPFNCSKLLKYYFPLIPELLIPEDQLT